MVPALEIVGMLSEIDEGLLEIPVAFLGMVWMTLGWAMLRRPTANPTSP